MNKHINNIWIVEVPQFAILLFIVFNTLAMIFYSGGTYLNNNNEGYSFIFNFLSDLGRTISFSNKTNYISAFFFNSSLILSSIVFITFFYKIKNIFRTSNDILVLIGSIFGICGGICLLGVGITPSNLYFHFHIIFANWIFRFFLCATLFFILAIWKDNSINNKANIGYLLFSVSIFIYIMISEFGPNPQINLIALNIQVVSQKIILIIFLIAIYIQTVEIKKIRNNE